MNFLQNMSINNCNQQMTAMKSNIFFFGILYLNKKCIWINVYDNYKEIKQFNTISEAEHFVDNLRKDPKHEINFVQRVCICKYDGKLMLETIERY